MADENIINDDDLIDYMSLNKHLKEDTERKKNQTYLEFEEMGSRYVSEIEKKSKNKKTKQIKLIPYILKHAGDKYDEDELMSYSFDDVNSIYIEIKKEKRPFILKFIYFIFNIE